MVITAAGAELLTPQGLSLDDPFADGLLGAALVVTFE